MQRETDAQKTQIQKAMRAASNIAIFFTFTHSERSFLPRGMWRQLVEFQHVKEGRP